MKANADIEAEEALLGAMLIGGSAAVSDAVSTLSRDAFYRPQHGMIFETIKTMVTEGQPVDKDSVLRRIHADGQTRIEPSVVGSLANGAMTAANIAYHARIVREMWARRSLAAAAAAAVSAAEDPSQEITASLGHLAELISEISLNGGMSQLHSMKALVADEYKAIEARHANDNQDSGLYTGLTDLDETLGGIQPSDLVVIGARPSMGKTAMGMQIALNVAVKQRLPVLFVSSEMRRNQVAQRALAHMARLSMGKFRRPRTMNPADWPKLADALGRTSTDLMQVVDAPVTPLEIMALARLCKARVGLGLVVIDYLQIVRPIRREDTREREVAAITSSLKALAIELNVPVLVLAQLNRALASRTSKVPQLSDLRESGSIEQDSDVVMFLHREGYYDASADQTDALVYVAKHRNGETGQIHVQWDAPTVSFRNALRQP